MDTEAVLVKKKGRGILAISRPFPVGRYILFHTAPPQAPRSNPFFAYMPTPSITHRDKSLAGFSIWFAYLAKGEIYKLDMCLRTRYAFAYLAKSEICKKRKEFISYRIDAKRQYIELE